MTVDVYQVVKIDSSFYIKDKNNDDCYRFEGASQELLQVAVEILNHQGHELDLSKVRFEKNGMYLGEDHIGCLNNPDYQNKFQSNSPSNSPLPPVFQDTLERNTVEKKPEPIDPHKINSDVDEELPKAATRSFKGIRKFFQRLRNFVVIEIFKNIFSKAKYKAHHDALATEFIKPTQSKIQAVSDFAVRRNEGAYAYVPDELFLSQELSNKTGLNRKIGGEKVTPESGVVEAPVFKSGGHEVIGYDARRENIESGAVVPTSTRYAKDKNVSNHLINCFMTHNDGVGIIRTGVINTPEKAEEFKKAVIELQGQMGRGDDQPVRVMSHQLNSPETESKMIENQHTQLLSKRKRKEFEVGHLNAPCNRFYHHHNKFGNVPVVSSILSGEKKSHEQNVEGMVQYLAWMIEDFGKNEDQEVKSLANKLEQKDVWHIITLQEDVNKKFDKIVELENQIVELDDEEQRKQLKAEIKELKKEIQKLRTEIIHGNGQEQGLKDLHTYLVKVFERDVLAPKDSELEKASQTLTVYRKLLGAQLEFKGAEVDRNQEHLMFFALDKSLGVISAMNCKSGLDRTGFLFALFLSAMDLQDSELMEIALNWKTYSLELNKLYREKDYDPDLVLSELNGRADYGKNLKVFFDMQHTIFQHLLKVSLPITGINTGLIGLKYHEGITENLFPLYCLPPVVKTEEGAVIQILTYDSKGKPKGLTSDGHALITQLSMHRGA